MTKNILIPTDFQLSSLNAIKKVVIDLEANESVQITLVHGYVLSDSITDLLFYSPNKIINKLANKEFIEGCQLLQNKYASVIKKVNLELFHGQNQNAFQQFCQRRGIHKAYIPSLLLPTYVSKNSFDLSDFIRKSLLDVYEFEKLVSQEVHTDSVSDLFLNEV